MPYIPLDIPDTTPKALKMATAATLEIYLNEIHSLLSVPAKPAELIERQFEFSAAVMLLSVVAGASTTIYGRQGSSGSLFRGILTDFYPWDLDPPVGRNPPEAAQALYKYFRNPLVHSVGIGDGKRKVKLGRIFPGVPGVQQEARIDELACRSGPPGRPTMRFEPDRMVLWLDGFYWGVRQMVERVLSDRDRCSEAMRAIKDGKFGQER